MSSIFQKVYVYSAALIAMSKPPPTPLQSSAVSVCLQCCPHRSVQVCPQ